jgi:hypothetical protein
MGASPHYLFFELAGLYLLKYYSTIQALRLDRVLALSRNSNIPIPSQSHITVSYRWGSRFTSLYENFASGTRTQRSKHVRVLGGIVTRSSSRYYRGSMECKSGSHIRNSRRSARLWMHKAIRSG